MDELELSAQLATDLSKLMVDIKAAQDKAHELGTKLPRVYIGEEGTGADALDAAYDCVSQTHRVVYERIKQLAASEYMRKRMEA